MEKIIFNKSDKIYDAKVTIIGHIASVVFVDEMPAKEILVSGFMLVNEHNLLPQRDCSAFKTIYKMLDGSVQLSDNGSEYQNPQKDILVTIDWDDNEDMDVMRPDTVDVYLYKDGKRVKTETATKALDWQCIFSSMDVQTYEVRIKAVTGYEANVNGYDVVMLHEPLNILKQNKIDDMNVEQQESIKNGIDVQLEDGTVEHFTLTDHDQTSMIGLAFQVNSGVEKIPWHTSDHEEGCKYYSNADMRKITDMATFFVTYSVTYYRDLRRYIMSMNNAETIKSVYYGMDIPEEFQSVVLKDLIAQKALLV